MASRSIANEVKLFLQQKKIKLSDGWTCYQCHNVFHSESKPSQSLSSFQSNLSKIFINKTTGEFDIPLSSHHGKWSLFQELCHAKSTKNTPKLNNLLLSAKASECPPNIVEMWKSCLKFSALNFHDIKSFYKKFQLEGLDLDKLSEFDIRCDLENKHLVIPYYDVASTEPAKQLRGIKVIHNDSYCISEECSNMTGSYTFYPHQNRVGLFGLNSFVMSKPSVVVTANEFDALAINSTSEKYSSISLPFGVNTLPINVLSMLENFSEIILWFGSHLQALEASEMFAKKLGAKRCSIVRRSYSNTPGAMLAVKHGMNVDDAICMAVRADDHKVVSYVDLCGEVRDELTNPHKFAGIPWKRFWNLNKKLKGHRRGELTVLTGPTGSGKTTLLSEMSLDLAMQGVNTLWGSFEVSNKRLIICMLKQFSRIELQSNMERFDEFSERFKKLPITFMSYNGAEDINNVMQTIRQATYAYDIHHVIIDNLQFMMGAQSIAERFAYQDHVIGVLRKFTSAHHVHVTLVVHPRKEDDNLPLQIASVFGSAKVTQEADNVLILQHVKRPSEISIVTDKYLEVSKNRYDGELGRIKLYFNRKTLCMSPEPQTVIRPDQSSNSELSSTNVKVTDKTQSWVDNFKTSSS